jgi:hypothetical protein
MSVASEIYLTISGLFPQTAFENGDWTQNGQEQPIKNPFKTAPFRFPVPFPLAAEFWIPRHLRSLADPPGF